MKNKGFTLIELIAVLMIISIIGIVSIVSIVNQVKKQEEKNYEKFEEAVLNASEVYLEQNRELFPELTVIGGYSYILAGKLIELEYLDKNLENPKTEANIADDLVIKITVNEDLSLKYEIVSEIQENYSNTLNPIILSTTNNCIKKANETCSIEDIRNDEGILLKIRMNELESYYFYLVSDKDNILTLIMDKNLLDEELKNIKIKWNSNLNNINGPITVLEKLSSETKDWNDLGLIDNYSYSRLYTDQNYGYNSLNITSGIAEISKYDSSIETINGTFNSRLITKEELEILGCTTETKSCPKWIYNNLKDSEAYWTLTAGEDSSVFAWVINKDGNLSKGSDTTYYIRPVIQIEKIIAK